MVHAQDGFKTGMPNTHARAEAERGTWACAQPMFSLGNLKMASSRFLFLALVALVGDEVSAQTIGVIGDVVGKGDLCGTTPGNAQYVYVGELLVADTNGHLPTPGPNYHLQQGSAYKYSWKVYLDSTLSTVYYERPKGTRMDYGHRFRVSSQAMSIIQYFVWDGSDNLLGSCFVGPVMHVLPSEPNAVLDPFSSTSGRQYRHVNCDAFLCEKTIKQNWYRCNEEQNFKPELYSPNIYEQRHKCTLQIPGG